MKHRVFDDSAVAKMFNDDSLEQRGRDAGVPDPFGIHDDDRAARADAKAGGLAPLYPPGAEQQPFPLEQRGEQAVKLPPRLVG